MNVNRLAHRVCLAAAVVLAGTGVAFAAFVDVPVKHAPKGAAQSVRMVKDGARKLAPVGTISGLFGFSRQWDMVTQRLVCVKDADTLVFVQDVAFCLVNGRTLVLPEAPSRAGGDIFLAVEQLAEVFGPFSDKVLRWSSDNASIGLFVSSFTVTALSCVEDSTSTRVAMTLADSVAFTTTYLHPTFVITLPRATADTSLRLKQVCGLVDTVETIQIGNEVQVSMRLNEPVDTPVVRVLQHGRRVDVVFRPRGRGKPVPDSLLFKRGFDDTIGVVVIDPGHGGRDPGAIGPGGTQEKVVTLKIALALRDLLKKQGGVKVYLTRDTDEFVPLGQRTKLANDKQADFFVSIHLNAVSGTETYKKTVKGYKVFFLSQAKSEEDKMVAMMENAVVELEETPVQADYLQGVITEMVVNEYLRESQDLSIAIVESLGKSLTKVPRLHTGVGQANFYVLNGAFMPSVLVECAFVSNPSEEKLLGSDSFQKDLAEAIFDAIMDFKGKFGAGQ